MKNQGFTLIEMMVAVALFAVVMTGSLAALLSMHSVQKKTESLRIVNDNLNFALESMMREIRSGSGYSVNIAGDSFSFTNSVSESITYKLDGNRIKRIKGASSFQVTAPEAIVTTLHFNLQGEGAGDGQPRVIINIEGYAGAIEKEKSELKLQTTVSQRQLDAS